MQNEPPVGLLARVEEEREPMRQPHPAAIGDAAVPLGKPAPCPDQAAVPPDGPAVQTLSRSSAPHQNGSTTESSLGAAPSRGLRSFALTKSEETSNFCIPFISGTTAATFAK